jgi:hypothetical protein
MLREFDRARTPAEPVEAPAQLAPPAAILLDVDVPEFDAQGFVADYRRTLPSHAPAVTAGVPGRRIGTPRS